MILETKQRLITFSFRTDASLFSIDFDIKGGVLWFRVELFRLMFLIIFGKRLKQAVYFHPALKLVEDLKNPMRIETIGLTSCYIAVLATCALVIWGPLYFKTGIWIGCIIAFIVSLLYLKQRIFDKKIQDKKIATNIDKFKSSCSSSCSTISSGDSDNEGQARPIPAMPTAHFNIPTTHINEVQLANSRPIEAIPANVPTGTEAERLERVQEIRQQIITEEDRQAMTVLGQMSQSQQAQPVADSDPTLPLPIPPAT